MSTIDSIDRSRARLGERRGGDGRVANQPVDPSGTSPDQVSDFLGQEMRSPVQTSKGVQEFAVNVRCRVLTVRCRLSILAPCPDRNGPMPGHTPAHVSKNTAFEE